jgi:hypothetical protein
MVIAARLPFLSLATTEKSLYPIQEKKTTTAAAEKSSVRRA